MQEKYMPKFTKRSRDTVREQFEKNEIFTNHFIVVADVKARRKLLSIQFRSLLEQSLLVCEKSLLKKLPSFLVFECVSKCYLHLLIHN